MAVSSDMPVDVDNSIDSETHVRLTDGERAEVDAAAVHLSLHHPGLVDDCDWLAAARDMSGALPLRLRQRLRRFAWDPGVDAMLLVRNLPVDAAALPDTPTHAGSVQRVSTSVASALALLAFQLGDPVAFAGEKSGAIIQDVVPVPGMESFQGNAGSVMLAAHVENAFHAHRPDFVGLLCLRNDHANVAGLQVGSIRRALPLLPEATRRVLFQPRYVTEPPASFGGPCGGVRPHAVLSGDRQDPDLRVDFVSTRALDGEAEQAVRRLREALGQARQTITLTSGDLAFVDNRLAVHGRTAFRPRYDGRDRWLQRIFVHRDFRRSRVVRPDGGHVLSSAPAE